MSKTPTIREQIDKILNDYTDAIESGDMVLDVKEMEAIPAIESLISQSVIEELEKLYYPDTRSDGYNPLKDIYDRIQELKTLANKGGES